MAHSTRLAPLSQLQSLRRHFLQGAGLPFSEILPAQRVRDALADAAVTFRDRVFTPLVTLWAFLSQVVSKDHSCVTAVARLLAYRVAHGQPPCSARTGSYCKARQRLPEAVLTRLVRDTGRDLQRQSPAAWLWRGLLTAPRQCVRQVQSVQRDRTIKPRRRHRGSAQPTTYLVVGPCSRPVHHQSMVGIWH